MEIVHNVAHEWTGLINDPAIRTNEDMASGMVDMSASVSQSSVTGSNGMYRLFNIRYSVGQALRRLGIGDWNTDVVVTIVSKGVYWDLAKLNAFVLREKGQLQF
ncbi:hypothetical protein AXG93_898s1000 [Marchantia polymorpha subsp. ruderalis]|uniref:Uncharacterized protein n=1 Tax=Marchantia polymorpha subsp. ruderalis TaxID=1480154 RepID=A0A176VW79_MARPO|nr:hypothetical protein AXG93_898s1000 [Marchantia polymorpha subsp. ruderalis]